MFTIKEIIEITNGEIINKNINNNVDKTKYTISTDTRTIGGNSVYLSLIGEKFDGHNFIDDAILKGVRVYITQNKINKENTLGILVKNTKEAYLKLAKYYKDKISPKTIAVTGSCGKTTTKEMIFCVLSGKYKTHKSKLNYNNEIGLCQTILSMKNDTEVLIVEAAMRGLGEIELISKYLCPDISIITNIGTAHIGRLGCRENIAKAKCEIFKYTNKNGLAIVSDDYLITNNMNYDGEIIKVSLKRNCVKNIKQKIGSTSFDYKDFNYKINIEGEYNVENALFAIETGLKLNITPNEINSGLNNYRPIGNRWNIINYKNMQLINDSYNANPNSMIEAIKTFFEVYKCEKTLVLGDMGELGDEEIKYHQQIGEFLNNYEFENLITVGKLSKNINLKYNKKSVNFDDIILAKEYIFDNINKGAVFFKASRFMKFEKIIQELIK